MADLTSAQSTIQLEKLVSQLEAALVGLMTSHEELLCIMQLKRTALREAKYSVMADYCQQENVYVQRISEAEKNRQILVATLTQHLDPDAQLPMSMVQLADALGEPIRGRLLVQRHQLRQKMQQVQRETAVAKAATQSLADHMQGLLQTVGRVMTGVPTYGAGGKRPPAATAVSTFNTTA